MDNTKNKIYLIIKGLLIASSVFAVASLVFALHQIDKKLSLQKSDIDKLSSTKKVLEKEKAELLEKNNAWEKEKAEKKNKNQNLPKQLKAKQHGKPPTEPSIPGSKQNGNSNKKDSEKTNGKKAQDKNVSQKKTNGNSQRRPLKECYNRIKLNIDGETENNWTSHIKTLNFNNSLQQITWECIYVAYENGKITRFYYDSNRDKELKFYVSKKYITDNTVYTNEDPLSVRLRPAEKENNVFLKIPKGFKVTPVDKIKTNYYDNACPPDWMQIELFEATNISFVLVQ